MKRWFAGFLLAARGNMMRVAAAVLGTSAAQAVVFAVRFRRCLSAGFYDTVESLFGLPARCIWIAGLTVLCVLLANGAGGSGSRMDYRVRCLPTRRWMFFAGHAVFDVLCCLLFWAAQLVTALLLCRLYAALAPTAWQHPQMAFLAFYRDETLHHLLPLADSARWFCTIATYLGLGLVAAGATMAAPGSRRGALATMAPLWAGISVGAVGSIASGIVGSFAILLAGIISMVMTIGEELP